jgi:hypothetical protein
VVPPLPFGGGCELHAAIRCRNQPAAPLPCLLIPLQGLGPRGSALWLTIAAVLVANAMFHVRATLRMREYSPGLVTSLSLYLPLGIYGYLYLVRSGQASVGTAVLAALLGGSYNWISAGMHRRRARRVAGDSTHER